MLKHYVKENALYSSVSVMCRPDTRVITGAPRDLWLMSPGRSAERECSSCAPDMPLAVRKILYLQYIIIFLFVDVLLVER
jgi:hypothetical protein